MVLTGNATSSPNLSLHGTANWNAFSSLPAPGAEQYLGNDSFLSGGLNHFTTSEQNMNIIAMSTGIGGLPDASFSTPMVKGTIPS